MVCVSESSNFQVAPTSIYVTPTTPAIVQVTFTRDNIAQESNETVCLRLIPLSILQLGEILLDTIDITIIDTESELLGILENTNNGTVEQQQQNKNSKKLCICAKYKTHASLPRPILYPVVRPCRWCVEEWDCIETASLCVRVWLSKTNSIIRVLVRLETPNGVRNWLLNISGLKVLASKIRSHSCVVYKVINY